MGRVSWDSLDFSSIVDETIVTPRPRVTPIPAKIHAEHVSDLIQAANAEPWSARSVSSANQYSVRTEFRSLANPRNRVALVEYLGGEFIIAIEVNRLTLVYGWAAGCVFTRDNYSSRSRAVSGKKLVPKRTAGAIIRHATAC